jgi:hypothetical protein
MRATPKTRLSSLLLSSLLAALSCVGVQGAAQAQTVTNCGNTVLNPANHTVTVTPSPNIASYNPYSGAPATQSLSITVTRNGNGVNNPCRLGVYIEGGRPSKTLASGANTLTYDMLSSGASILYPAGAPPTSVVVLTINRNSSQTATVSFEVPANQVVATGTYLDAANEVTVTNVNNAGVPQNTITRRTPLSTQAFVTKTCQLGTPSLTTLAFAAADIPKGLPNQGVIKSTSMTGSCTAPANLKLTGQALEQIPPAPPRSGFDNTINYTAIGTFNAATVTLNTTGAPQTVMSAAPAGAANSVVSGGVGVNVNLRQANPLLAGSYTGTLTVTLEPAP